MAASLSIAVSPTVVANGQNVTVTATLFNAAGGTAVQVLRIEPFILASGMTGGTSAAVGNANLVIGGTTLLAPTAAANATLSWSWMEQGFAPPAPSNPPYPNTPAYDKYTVGAVVYLSDGTAPSASSSFYVYPLVKDTTLVLTAMPGNGALSFDLNLESGLIGAGFSHYLVGAVPSPF